MTPFLCNYVQTGRSALHEASLRGYDTVVHALLKAKADLNARTVLGRETPLHLAIRAGHDGICRLLLEKGAMKNPESKLGHTPLHLVTDLNCLHVLLEFKVDTHIKNKEGDTAYRTAVKNGCLDIADAIAEAEMAQVQAKVRRERQLLQEKQRQDREREQLRQEAHRQKLKEYHQRRYQASKSF